MGKKKKKGKKKAKNMHTTSTYEHCKHTGEVPVDIGGYPVHLARQWDISGELITKIDVMLPLNGSLPSLSQLPFGSYIPAVVCCHLADRQGVPSNWGTFIADIAQRIKNGTRVLAWCMGSHGRTGTFAASLIAIMEPDIDDPIAAIRARHCKEAVESKEQATAIFALRGQELPANYAEEFKPRVSSAVFDFLASKYTKGSITTTYQSSHSVPATTFSPAMAGHGSKCLCERCILHYGGGKHDDTIGFAQCRCRRCTLMWKMDQTGDLEAMHKHSKHAENCFCSVCWVVDLGHKRGCICKACIFINTGAPECDPETYINEQGKIVALARATQPPPLPEVDTNQPALLKAGME